MFDARSAKALAPGHHLIIEQAPGLRLVATASRRTWTYRYRSPVDGRMRQVRLGHWPAMGLPAALAAWERLKAARDSGGDPALDQRAQRREAASLRHARAYTVADGCRDHLADLAQRAGPKWYGETERMLRIDASPLHAMPMASVTRSDAYALIDGMRDRPVQAARLRQMLGAVWDRAHDAGRLAPDAPNWWRLILRGKLPSRGKLVRGVRVRAKRVLSEAELRALVPWLGHFPPDIRDALTLYLWTCCRGAEIVGMRRAEIADEAGVLWWTIPRERLKMRRSAATQDLRVPLVGRAADIVRRRLLGGGEYVFPSPAAGRPHIAQKAISVSVWMHMPTTAVRPSQERPRLPVTDWAPHDLRRTARTLLAALGCPDAVAEAILGHAPPGIVAVYNRHRYDAERVEWLTRLAQRLEAFAAPGPAGDQTPAATPQTPATPAKASRRARR